MPKMLGINIGFVTNSSSMIYHFPKQLLDDPKIAQFITAFELEQGLIGSEMWNRSECSTIALTKEQKREAQAKLNEMESEYAHIPKIDIEDDSIVVIYGDEYDSLASTLAHMLRELAREQKLEVSGTEFN